MDRNELKRKVSELVEAIENLSRTRHNYSQQLEVYTRDLLDEIIDEIKH